MNRSIVARAYYNHFNITSKKLPNQYRVYNRDGILAYKFPEDSMYLNLVWANKITHPDIIRKVDKSFYKQTPHCWMINEEDQESVFNAIAAGLIKTDPFYEMVYDINSSSIIEINKTTLSHIKEIRTDDELKEWCDVFSKGYQVHTAEYIYGYKSGVHNASCPYTVIGYNKDNKAVCTGQIYISGGYACIIGISTLEEERGKGYSREINLHLIEYAKRNGCKLVALNSLPNVQEFYLKLGFKIYSKDWGFVHQKYCT